MRKGITPVIAVVLLLMITIAMVGFAYLWFSKFMTSTTISVSETSEQQVSQMGQTVRIDSSQSGSILVRHSGTSIIPAGNVVVEGLSSKCNNTADLSPGSTFICAGTCESGAAIVASAPGNVDHTKCIKQAEELGDDGDDEEPECGNGACGTGETCSSCPQDCGSCIPQSLLISRVYYLGFCPGGCERNLTILANGTATYYDRAGETYYEQKEGNLTAAELNDLIDIFEENDFFSLDDTYRCVGMCPTDTGGTTFRFRNDTIDKSVWVEGSAEMPAQLVPIDDELDAIVAGLQ